MNKYLYSYLDNENNVIDVMMDANGYKYHIDNLGRRLYK